MSSLLLFFSAVRCPFPCIQRKGQEEDGELCFEKKRNMSEPFGSTKKKGWNKEKDKASRAMWTMRTGHATYDDERVFSSSTSSSTSSPIRAGGGGREAPLLYPPLSDFLRTHVHLAHAQERKPPVVFDIDDTLVWNRGEDDVPIPQMVSLFKECVDLGFPTYVVTARNEKWRKETTRLMASLKTGLPVNETTLLMRRRGEDADSSKHDHRSTIADRHGQILFSVGDQWWDLGRRIPRDVDREAPVVVVFFDNKQLKMGAKLPFVGED